MEIVQLNTSESGRTKPHLLVPPSMFYALVTLTATDLEEQKTMGLPVLGWGKEAIALVINVTEPLNRRDEIAHTCCI